jgi:predicted AlkP superfamily pyrophosphatase or phosphodiesterase
MHRPTTIVALLALVLSIPGETTPQSSSDAHVILISLDGFAASRLEDEGLELPNLRAVARSGAWAESSETVFPSTDDPAHTSILTGVPPRLHGVIGNRMRNRNTGEYFRVTNKPHADSVKAPTIFDAAKSKGYRTASLFWPESRDDEALDHNIPFVLTGDANADIGATDSAFLAELRENDVPIDLFFAWYNDLPLQVTADRILTRVAVHLIETYQPQLLAIRLPAMDRYQHEYGPDHYLAKAAFTAADYNVGLIRRAVERTGIADQTTYFVVSDHGFHTIEHAVNIYPLFAQAGLLEEVNLHTYYLSVIVELTENFDPQKHQKSLDRVIERALALDGISRVIRPYEFAQMGLPSYEEDPHVLGHYIFMGESDTRAVFDEDSDSTRRTVLSAPIHVHGYLPDDDHIDPVFLMSGRGIRSGVRLDRVHNFDIAPTIAYLLDLEMNNLSGRILTEALTDPP